MVDTANTASNQPSNKTRHTKALRILACALVLVMSIYILLTYLGQACDKNDNTYVDVVIPNGATTAEIAEILEENGIISSASTFEFLTAISFNTDKYKAGFYSLSPSMDIDTISSILINGITTTGGFTIPAGYTIEQVAEALAQIGFADKDEFLAIANSGIYNELFDFLEGADSIEGFILPTKYVMSKDADEDMIITAMLYEFDAFYSEEYRARADEIGLSTRDVVIMASVIEQLISGDKDKAEAAGEIIYALALLEDNELDAVCEILEELGLTDVLEIIEAGYPASPLCSPSEETIGAVLYYTEYVSGDESDDAE